jgi:hypothetical protein
LIFWYNITNIVINYYIFGTVCYNKEDDWFKYMKKLNLKEEEKVLIKLVNKKSKNQKFLDSLSTIDHSSLINNLIAEAAISPKYHNYLSQLLKRELKQEKNDTRDYNVKVISKWDIQAIELMDAGLKNDCFPGDSLTAHAKISNSYGDSWLLDSLKKSIGKKDYVSFPFTSEISADIRARFLLKTDLNDTFESVFQEVESLITKVMSKEDWDILKSSMVSAQKRLAKESVYFLEPLEGGVVGKVKELNEKELKQLKLTKDFSHIDIRSDDHDLVALKELIFCLQGNLVAHLSILAGSFSKCILELNKKGYRGVVFKVEKSKLISIKLATLKEKLVPFGPIEAVLALNETFGSEIPNGKIDKTIKYYATVHGYIAGPKNKDQNWGYESKCPVNEDIIPSSETFLFHSDGQNGIMSTRLYFYADHSTDLNVIHQNMSAVFGDSDQMFHSCAYDPNGDHFKNETKDEFSKKMLETDLDNEPGIKVTHYLFMDEHVPPEAMCLLKEYFKIAKQASDSMYGENSYTLEKYIKHSKSFGENTFKTLTELKGLGFFKNCYPLTSRFIIYNYFEGINGGLTRDPQLTTFRRIKRYNFKGVMEDWMMGLRVHSKMKKYSGILEDETKTVKEAFNESFDQDEKDYMNTGKVKKADPKDKK